MVTERGCLITSYYGERRVITTEGEKGGTQVRL